MPAWRVDLAKYDNSDYSPGAGLVKRLLWYVMNALLFDSWILPSSCAKRLLLRLFGARVGEGVVVKPKVNIKYPWHIELGDHVWIGEGVWLDSLAMIKIGSNVCISQGAYLCTGNHDYKDAAFGLITRKITVEEGAWIGAKSIICPGVTIGMNAVLTVSTVATRSLPAGGIYSGNPAEWVRDRIFRPLAGE